MRIRFLKIPMPFADAPQLTVCSHKNLIPLVIKVSAFVDVLEVFQCVLPDDISTIGLESPARYERILQLGSVPVNTVYWNRRSDFVGTRFSWVEHAFEKKSSGRSCPLAHLGRRFFEELCTQPRP